MPHPHSAMLSLLLWHYLQAGVVVVGLGFFGLLIHSAEDGDYWSAVGSAGAAAVLIWLAGQM